MRISSLRSAWMTSVLFLLVAGASPVFAAHVSFFDNADVVTVVPDANFECGFNSTVTGENASVGACWFTNSPVGFAGTAVAYMVEPAGSEHPGAVSDKISITFHVVQFAGLPPQAEANIDFISDDDAAPPVFPPANVPVLVEDGSLQLVNGFFSDPATGAAVEIPANITIAAASDVGEPTPVQEISWGHVKAHYR